MLVQEIMTREVVAVHDDDTVRHAAEVLLLHRIASAPVLDAAGHLVGMVSEADLLRGRVEADPRGHLRPVGDEHERPPVTVAEVLSPRVLAVHAADDAALAARLLLDHGIKALPVLQGRRVIGVVARRDLLRAVARPDDDVRRDVLALLAEVGADEGCEVSVEEGAVTLSGGAPGAPARRVAAVLARTVPGVTEVKGEGEPTW